MIETLLATILKIALFTSLIDILSSAFKLQSYIRLVSNFIIMATLISPFTGLNLQDIKFDKEALKFFYDKENYDSSLLSSDKLNNKTNTSQSNVFDDEDYYDEIARNYSENVVYKEIVEDEYENLIQKYLKQNDYNVYKVEIEVDDNLRDIDQIKISIKENEVNAWNKTSENTNTNSKYNLESEMNKIKTDITTLLEVDEKIIKMSFVR